MPVDLVVLDAVAYSDKITGPWVPMSTMTSIFKEPKRMPAGDPHDIRIDTPPHDHENYAIEDVHEVIPGHQPPAVKMFTSQS